MKKPDPDQELKDEIFSIRQNHPNYGYRRTHATLVKSIERKSGVSAKN
jgi:putative transposase